MTEGLKLSFSCVQWRHQNRVFSDIARSFGKSKQSTATANAERHNCPEVDVESPAEVKRESDLQVNTNEDTSMRLRKKWKVEPFCFFKNLDVKKEEA